MSRIDRNYSVRRAFAAAVLAVAVVVTGATMSAEARSITGVRHLTPRNGVSSLAVTFEAGEPGDEHALYIAYDTEDKGADISNWAALQRGCNVAADATSATIPVSPLLTGAGYTVCRVFLTSSAAPYDTLIESLRQTGTQYIDTGIKPNGTSVAVMDTKFDSNATRQQRFFGISSGDDDSAGFSFDCYINGSGKFASACKDGKGDWKEAGAFTTDRVRISLSAKEKHRIVITNLVTGAQIVDKKWSTTCSATSVTNLFVFVQHYVKINNTGTEVRNIANGAYLYGFSVTTNAMLACNYLPCMLGGRAGVYDTVTGTIRYSAVATDFEAGGGPIACSLLAGEAQLSVAPSVVDLSVYDDPETGSLWRGTASGNWNVADANWTIDGVASQAWQNGNDAVFNDNASAYTVTIPSGTTVTPSSILFDNATDYTLAGAGVIAGTGSFSKYQEGKLTISGINHTFTGDVLLAGGEIVLPSDNDQSDVVTGSLGNPRVPRSVVVSNATLNIQGKNPFGGGGRSSTPIQAVLKCYNSTLELTKDFCFNAGDVYLHNSTVNFHGGLNNYVSGKTLIVGTVGAQNSKTFWGSFSMANLYFSGDRQVVFAASGSGINNSSGMSIGKFGAQRQGVIDVPDMTGNDNSDVIIRVPIIWSSGNATDPGIASGFRKTGAGTLELGDGTAHAYNSTYTGDVDVVEGTLFMNTGNATDAADRSSVFGAQRYPHTFTVHPGATLHLGSSDTMGQFYAENNVTVHVNGGTLKQTANKTNGFGPLILENATVSYSGVTGAWPTLGFGGGLTVIGTNTLTFANTDNATLFFAKRDGSASDCYVAEISGKGTADDTTDLKFNARIADAPNWGTKHSAVAFNMRKTGPGMLELANASSTTTGRIEIVEGTVKLATALSNTESNFECPEKSTIGNLSSSDLSVSVNGGALWITQNDQFGQANAVNNFTLAVTNGTIRQTSGKVNAMPFLDLYDATLDYNGANTGAGYDTEQIGPYGTFVFAQRVRFDGTRPYDLQNVGGTCYFSLGWQNDSYQEIDGEKIYQHGKTEFHVADITQNAEPDVTIGVVLKPAARWAGNKSNSLYANTYFRTGLLKTGPGTLRLNCCTAADKYYSEATRVNGGTLLVDAATFNSTNVIVQAGAYLGGTGTVVRATIEAGGGFTAVPGQTRPLTLTAAELPADGVVTLDVPYTGDLADPKSVRVCVPVVTADALAGAHWRVTLNGSALPRGLVGKASIRDGIVYGTVQHGGLMIIVR